MGPLPLVVLALLASSRTTSSASAPAPWPGPSPLPLPPAPPWPSPTTPGAVGRKLSLAELVQLAASVGFSDPRLAAAIAMAESQGYPSARGDGGMSLGLWQIYTAVHHDWSAATLLDPMGNAQAALALSNRGADWSPWSTAWDDATHRTGYLGARAPFRPFYTGA